MFSHILAATDGSEHANKAVELASDLARLYDSKLTVFHVLLRGHVPEALRHMVEAEHLVKPRRASSSDPANMPAAMAGALQGGESYDSYFEVLEAIGRVIVDRGADTARHKGLKKVETLIEDGDPVRCILECARREKCDLIVVGSRGLSDVKGLLLGSVSHKLGQLAPVTCVTVR